MKNSLILVIASVAHVPPMVSLRAKRSNLLADKGIAYPSGTLRGRRLVSIRASSYSTNGGSQWHRDFVRHSWESHGDFGVCGI